MKLCPTVFGVVDVGPDQGQPITDVGPREMPVVTGHELDHQVAVLDGTVVRHQHAPVLAVQGHQDMDVAILLVADVRDRTGNPAAGIPDKETVGVVDAVEDPA
jgi:hypothetical protein